MKGLILAGGSGTRLYPMTKAVSKHLFSVYDKPSIFYPLSILMLADIRDIAIIVNPKDISLFKELLGTGERYGIQLSYLVQETPAGIADAFNVAEQFLDGSPSTLILGDNFFYGYELPKRLRHVAQNLKGATIFTLQVKNPQNFGVIEFNSDLSPARLIEKPLAPKSNWAVTGLYLYDKHVCDYVKELKPSARGELEITDLNNLYLNKNQLQVERLGRGTAWLDTGTPDGLLSCATFVRTLEERQGLKVSCLEEIALNREFLTKEQLRKIVDQDPSCAYSDYIRSLLV